MRLAAGDPLRDDERVEDGAAQDRDFPNIFVIPEGARQRPAPEPTRRSSGLGGRARRPGARMRSACGRPAPG